MGEELKKKVLSGKKTGGEKYKKRKLEKFLIVNIFLSCSWGFNLFYWSFKRKDLRGYLSFLIPLFWDI